MADEVIMVRSIRERRLPGVVHKYQIDVYADKQVQVILMDEMGFHVYQAQSAQHPSEKSIDLTVNRLVDRIEDEYFTTKG
jgi:K+/H+ antiporter YhaU regulatory subunit KhtT